MRRRAGFTLVEMLVVLAVVGVLMALVVPAVQQARAAAARAKCQNNLRQIVLAAQQYHDAFGSLPPGMRYQDGEDPYLLMSWLTELLPFLEQQNLWAVSLQAYQQSPSALNNPPHVGLATVLNIFVCPADARAFHIQFAPRDGIDVALTSYLGVEGRDLFSQDGVLFLDSRIRIGDVSDGTSQTLLAGERPASADFQFGWWYAGGGQQVTGSGDMVLGVQEQNVASYQEAPCPPGPYGYGRGDTSNQCDLFHFYSLHSGGAHFVFVDGSVHFLSYDAAAVLPALASRAGGEAAPPVD